MSNKYKILIFITKCSENWSKNSKQEIRSRENFINKFDLMYFFCEKSNQHKSILSIKPYQKS